MDTAFDNSNGATLDNLNQDIFQKSNVLTDGDLDMDIKNTNITSPSIDTLNNIQSYTIDNQKSSEIIIDQNRISNDDYNFDENKQHSQVSNIAPLNGKTSEYTATDNYFGPESNVDDDTTGSPVTEEFNTKNDEIENNVNIIRPDEMVATHGIHYENIDYLKTVDEAEECELKKDEEWELKKDEAWELKKDEECELKKDEECELKEDEECELKEDEECELKKDEDVSDHHERHFYSEEFESESKMVSADVPSDFVTGSTKLPDAILPEKVDDPIENPIQAENVIVPESGEESEDEWKYIKVNNETETQERNNISQEAEESQNLCPDLVNDNQTQDDEIVGIEETCLSEADMASQLNPDAKEFVPTSPSPTNTTPLNSLEISDVTGAMANLNLHLQDDLVSQSPRKETEKTLVDVPVPEENDFLNDILKRPADLDSTIMSDIRPGSSSSQCSYQEMNLKEAMHGDEKQEYAPDVLTTPDQGAFEVNSTNGDHEEFINILNKSMRNQDVMNTSFYNDGTSDSNNPFKVDLNAVHRLPSSDDENEEERVDTAGTKYAFEDTEFGMSDFIQMAHPELQNGASGIENGGNVNMNVNEPKSNETDTIVGAVQEMISEKMAVLSECNLLGNDTLPETENISLLTAENTSLMTAENTSSMTAENTSLMTAENSVDVSEVQEPTAVAPEVISVLADNDVLPTADSSSADVEIVEEPVVASSVASEQCLMPEQISILIQENENAIIENTNNDIVAPEIITETLVNADTTAVAGAAVAAAVVATTVAAATTKAKLTKSAEPKTKSAPVATKKPLSAGTTAKPKAKPTTVSDTTATKTAPVPRPRTVVSQPPVRAIDKKPTSTLAAKKPVNGDIKSTTIVSAPKRPISSTTAKSTISARPATTTTATARVTTTRLTTKTSTTTTATTGTDAAKRVSATKTTTTTSTLRARPSSEKPTTLSKSSISKVNTSATDKSTKDSVNRLQTSGARAPVSPRSATAPRTGTLAAKKPDATKVPSVPAPIKRPPVTTASSKLVPSQKRPISSTTNKTTLEPVKKTASTLKKSQADVTNESKPKENGNETNGTHALDMPIETSNAVNVEQEPVIM